MHFCLFHFLEASLIFLCQLLISCPLLTHVVVINFDVYLFFLLIFGLYWNTWKNLMKLQHLKTKTKKKLRYNLWSEVLVAKSRLTLLQAHGQGSGSSVHGILQAIILSGQPSPSPGDLPYPGIEPRSSALQGLLLYSLSHQGSTITYIQHKINVSCRI